MRRARVALALGLSAAYAIGLLASLSSARVPTLPGVTLRGSVTSGDPHPTVTFSGSARVPDGTVLTLRLTRLRESRWEGRLLPTSWVEAVLSAPVSGGVFTCDHQISQPGIYRVAVESEPHRWTFLLDLWDDGHLARMADDFRTIDTAADKILGLTIYLCRVTATPKSWALNGVQTLAHADRVANGVEQLAALNASYPAALHDLRAAARLLRVASRHFRWAPDGTFAGAFDADSGEWVRDPDGLPFNFSAVAALVSRAQEVARREYALWAVKDARRLRREDLLRPGPADEHLDLQSLIETLGGDLDHLEARLRADPRPAPSPSRPLEKGADLGRPATARDRKVDEARRLLAEADRRWEDLSDTEAPTLYRRLLADFPDTLPDLKATARVHNRAR